MRKPGIYLAMFILAGFFLPSVAFCQPAPLRIGLSKASPNYIKWLQRTDPSAQVIDLYLLPIDQAVKQLGLCSGLLLTGGEDVDPGRYGKKHETERCTEINPRRDSLETALIEKAFAMQMPVAGVCRGQQILNVYLGGTLIVDIPTDVGREIVHQCEDYLSCYHEAEVRKNSMLAKISDCSSARVTTNHHQAVDLLSPLLTASAFSADRVIEAIEWRDPGEKSFLMGVQWHPERMETGNPLSGPIAEEFLRQCAIFSVTQNQLPRR